MIGQIIGLIIVGLVVGLLGRLVHPGRDKMGMLATIALGIVSALIAGLIVGGFVGFIVAIIVAALLVALWSRYDTNRQSGLRRAMRV